MQDSNNKLWTGKFIMSLIMSFTFFLGIMFLTSGMPAHVTREGGSAFTAGLMTTAFMLAAIGTRPIIGFVLQKVNIRAINLATSMVTAGLIFALSLTNNIGMLLFLRALQGICFGILSTTISTMATRVIPDTRMGQGIGYFGMSQAGATSIAPTISLALLANISYSAMVMASAGLVVITFFLNLIAGRSEGPSNNAYQHFRHTKNSDGKGIPSNNGCEKVYKYDSDQTRSRLIDYAFDRRAFIPALLVFCFSFTLGGVTSFMTPLLKEAGLAANFSSIYFLVQAAALLIARAICGKVFDRHGHKIIMYLACVFGITGLILLSRASSLPILLTAGVFYGATYGLVTTTGQTLAVKALEKDKQATANAMYLNAMDLGMALGAPILGLVAGMRNYRTIFLTASLSFVVLLIIYSLVYGKKIKRA